MKFVIGFESTHVVSKFGHVIALPKLVEQPNHPSQKVRKTKKRILRPALNSKGYYQVLLKNGLGKNQMCYVHRIVALAYFGEDKLRPHVNHKDRNKKNNFVGNLEWCTASENNFHRYKTNHLFLREANQE